MVMSFKLQADFKPTGDQPEAIKKLVAGLSSKQQHQTLLGVTGSGKTFTMAKIIESVQRPTLIMSHNKTLAAQLYGEFKQFFPDAAVHYFVSYYDYYQPEAYIPQTDTYIEKEAQINEEIDRLRHAATQALMTRRDCIIVASVSCIYGLGEKLTYEEMSLKYTVGQMIKRNALLRDLVRIQYERDDISFKRGSFRVKGENIDVHLTTGEEIISLSFDGDVLDKIWRYRIPGEKKAWTMEFKKNQGEALETIKIIPAKHFMTPADQLAESIENIREELEERHAVLLNLGKFAEAQRLKSKTEYDLEMLENLGYCNGIENYSRQLTLRAAGVAPDVLLDYLPADYLLFIDESHVSIPQIRGMYAGDHSRKETLIEFGWRLPSAIDNRPLNFKEFCDKINQVIYVSATPSEYELTKSSQVVKQIIRPTGLLDPSITIRPTANQITDLIKEIKIRTERGERTLAITLTKRMAEELASFLEEEGIKATYLHSEIVALERLDILRDLKSGKYDVLIGINLLREGLDLPEVSLVAILNADHAGFLRTATSLIQTMGRAARHEHGEVIMYGDQITPAMKQAIKETTDRRIAQIAYNKKHGITPRSTKNKQAETAFSN
ncbi:excinuclease ABC subunit B [Candidatus Falkowbacteria bacterium CG10_big_fil_rev_8_21_14_0_10_37_14]|uniref:Excinuclease ABC subunit B n=1 Tax=Candidatus Falkowbacteria bacterium CG10_big_fil_rev_8_21_14_0_10_37_14 TaxID=1974561 RepID=A0A2M6WSV1_9BACT|nr:excinuclease ABC subunit UvrB [Candidatus Falkowbacteria bacterium]PIT95880.1 MAG: excinuclease ABC subunit B [Candidatus Falkowbacteria bacterium CG10_big_fil_rev_8_21_14_0_10_37_14]